MINIEEHLGLARMCALKWHKRYIGKHEYDDFYQIGCLGLIKAARVFDESRGIKFSTVAVNYITYEISHFVSREKFFNKGEDNYYAQEPMLSLDNYVYNEAGDKETNFYEILGTEDMSENIVDNIVLHESLKKLDDIEHEIITLKYFKDVPQKDIAKKINYSQPHTSRLEKKAISKLSKMVQAV